MQKKLNGMDLPHRYIIVSIESNADLPLCIIPLTDDYKFASVLPISIDCPNKIFPSVRGMWFQDGYLYFGTECNNSKLFKCQLVYSENKQCFEAINVKCIIDIAHDIHDVMVINQQGDITTLLIVSTGNDQILRIKTDFNAILSKEIVCATGKNNDTVHYNTILKHKSQLWFTMHGLKNSSNVTYCNSDNNKQLLFTDVNIMENSHSYTLLYNSKEEIEGYIVNLSKQQSIMYIGLDNEWIVNIGGWTRGCAIINNYTDGPKMFCVGASHTRDNQTGIQKPILFMFKNQEGPKIIDRIELDKDNSKASIFSVRYIEYDFRIS